MTNLLQVGRIELLCLLNKKLNVELSEIYKKISKAVPEIEWKFHAPLIQKINELKRKECCNLSSQLSNPGNLSWCCRYICRFSSFGSGGCKNKSGHNNPLWGSFYG